MSIDNLTPDDPSGGSSYARQSAEPTGPLSYQTTKAIEKQLRILGYHYPSVEWDGALAAARALTAAFAIVERDRSDAAGLTRGAAAARRIADRYGEKGKDRSRADWRIWTAMSAGARAVALRLTELADAEDADPTFDTWADRVHPSPPAGEPS